jgi:hypothetical protein
VTPDQCGDEVRIAEGDRAHDDALDAGPEDIRNRLRRSKPAGHLEARSGPGERSDDRLDRRHLPPTSGPRAIQVDDVDPLGAGRGELCGDGQGVLGVDLFAVEVALAKAHDAPAAEVDRGQDRKR